MDRVLGQLLESVSVSVKILTIDDGTQTSKLRD